MNLHHLLRQRERAGAPVRVGVIGAGKFVTMFLAQARRTPGLHVAALCDLAPERARQALATAGWPEEAQRPSLAEAVRVGGVHVTDDAVALASTAEIDVVVEATGDPLAGTVHALAAIESGHHLVMVTVEADCLVGPALARRARAAGVVYSLAYGDQPALIAEQVDWARASGLEVVCAGKGTRYLPEYHASTPETVWEHYGLDPAAARAGGMNPKMFNSFLDGTKSAIEMAAVANACDLAPSPAGLAFPPCGRDDLPRVLRPREDGGMLDGRGRVEVVSSLERDGTPVPGDLRWGVYVCFAASDDYVARCFHEYGVVTDDTGRYSALYRPSHLIGLELGISIASVALRREPTGCPQAWRADVAALAKRDLAAGEVLDGEGGRTVWGRLMPAVDALAADALPIGLASGVRLSRAVPAGTLVRHADVDLDRGGAHPAIALRREIEAELSRSTVAGGGAGHDQPANGPRAAGTVRDPAHAPGGEADATRP